MARLEGKVAYISGGARGQGEAEARLFVSEGARVAIGDVLDTEGEALAKELGDDVLYIHHDVTSEDEWSAAISATTEEFGRLDVLVNNAGIFRVGPMAMTSVDEYMAVIKVNQLGVFLGMKTAAPALAAAGGGSIVNISSIAGLQGSAMTISYSSSKWAVRGMTKVAAMELAPLGIRVNSIHPGIIDTPMLEGFRAFGDDFMERLTAAIPLGRVAGPDDVAKLALYLASDDSAYSTGCEFVVDGGMTAGGSARR